MDDFFSDMPFDATPRTVEGVLNLVRQIIVKDTLTSEQCYHYTKLCAGLTDDINSLNQLLDILSDKRYGPGIDISVLRGVFKKAKVAIANGTGMIYANGHDITHEIVEFSSARLTDAAHDAEQILVNKKDAHIFEKGKGALVRLELRKNSTPRLKLIDSNTMNEIVQRHISWVTFDSDKGTKIAKAPPKELANMMITRSDVWPYKRLNAILNVPYFDPATGAIDATFGYNDKTGYFINSDVEVVNTGDAKQSLEGLRWLLRETQYDGTTPEERRDNEVATVAGLMTAVLRPSFSVTPGWITNAHEGGSGKSALHEIAWILARGDDPVTIAAGRGEEFEKRLGAIALSETSHLIIDNYNGVVRGEQLAQMISQTKLGIRRLGVSEVVEVDNRMFAMVNGNNIQVETEQRRRWISTYLSRQPGKQFSFVLQDVAKNNRSAFVCCILSIVQEYVTSGAAARYESKSAEFGGVAGVNITARDWDRIVRGSLLWLGAGDCLATGGRAAAEDSTHGSQISLLGELWHWSQHLSTDRKSGLSWLKQGEFRCSDIIAATNGNGIQQLSPELRSLIDDACHRSGRYSARTLGWHLSKLVGSRKEGYRLESRSLNGGSVYRVIQE